MLFFVFQKKKNKEKRKIMLQEFITSALVVDDDYEEVKDLITYLENDKDIWAKYYSPSDLESKTIPFNNRKIIFLDLYLDDSRSSTDNIAKIRKYFKSIIGKEFGTYGIVLWTKHTNHFEDFCDKIFQKNNPFTLPLFAIALDKTKYKKQGSYIGVLEELEEKLLNDVASSFFVEWNKAVKTGSDNTISTLYNLFDTNHKKNKYLEAVFFKLAQNHTGFPINTSIKIEDEEEKRRIKSFLQKDLIKSLMDSLQVEISNNYQIVDILFKEINKLNYNENPEEKTIVFSKLNSLLLLDEHNLLQESPMPGYIYAILDQTSPLYINELLYKKANENIDTHADFKDLKKRRVCIEITPPCDFALSKKQSFSRIIGGLQIDYDKTLLNNTFSTENYYKYLYPIIIPGFDKPQMIIFDFYRFQTINEDILKEQIKFKIILKAKDKLFADILQKLSSHTARLGIAVMYP